MKWLTWLIALVWLVNGLVCKVLNVVPRHEMIVGTILGTENSRLFTVIIGLMETALSVWIISGKYQKFTIWFQIIVVMTMNLIEYFLVPHLLLWGKFNLVFATFFCLLIFISKREVPAS